MLENAESPPVGRGGTSGHQGSESGDAQAGAAPFVSCRTLCEWTVWAQPNARLVYGHGAAWERCCRAELRDQVLKLQKLGLVTSHFVRGRDGEPDRHLLQRTQRPYLNGMLLS